MLAWSDKQQIVFDENTRPSLVVFVDAEEEFSWDTFSRDSISVRNLRHQEAAHRILSENGIRPVYLVDYAVASQRDGFAPLAEFLADGTCSIGAQLHPWINPPFDEEICIANTFAGNLGRELEAAKIAALTDSIRNALQVVPIVYRTGRYGIGPNTIDHVLANGYLVDSSIMPLTDYRSYGGRDFSSIGAGPFWLDRDCQLLELPVTVGFSGLLARYGDALGLSLTGPIAQSVGATAFAARSRLIEKIRLTPEGVTVDEAKRLTRTLYHRGQRAFALTYHSSSLLPGSNQYVRDQKDKAVFLRWLKEYCEFFLHEFGGEAATPESILAQSRSTVC